MYPVTLSEKRELKQGFFRLHNEHGGKFCTNYELRVQLGTGSWVNYRYRVFILPFNGRLPSVSENART